MEWYIMNGTGLRAITTELVINVGEDEWEVCSDVAEKLEELCEKLNNDDETMAVRRELALSDFIRSQLVIVVRLCACERLDVMNLALKALSKLTNPMYLLLSPDGSNRDSEKSSLFEDLHRIVVDFHEALSDETVMSKIIKHMEMLLEDSDDEAMDDEFCSAINKGLLVFRNLLTVRADTNQWMNEQAHNRIVCSLLNNDFGTILINMLLNPNMSKWYLSIAQLISLLFMSQNERDFTLFVLRDDRAKRNCNAVSENGSTQTSPLSFTESSNGSGSDGDTESTAFRCLAAQRGLIHSQVMTKDGGRQSLAKNSPLMHLKRRREESESDASSPNRCKEMHLDQPVAMPPSTSSSTDFGVVMLDGSQRSMASVVSEDGTSARAVSSGECSRCSSALSKSGCSSPEADSGQATSPSQLSFEEGRVIAPIGKVTVTLMREVRVKLLYFTHDLMRSTAVSKLCHCLQENMLTADKTLAHTIENYLLWLTGLFTKFGTLRDAGWDSVSHILSPQLFSYLTYRCTRLMMQVLQTEGNNQQLYLAYIRRLYLACRALHSAIQVVEFFIYKKKHMDKKAAEDLTNVQTYFLNCRDLRQFFLLAIRNFRPEFMSRLFLNEIIMCNHRYLLVVEELTSQRKYKGPLKMLDHVRQFATLSTMRQYAFALATFETNDKTLNECIFTLMYHVAGDCQQPEVLFQLPLMGLFTKIIESSTAVSQDAMNMIEYVMDRFLELAHLSPELCANFLYTANMAAAETTVHQHQRKLLGEVNKDSSESASSGVPASITTIKTEPTFQPPDALKSAPKKVEKVLVKEKCPLSKLEKTVKKEEMESEAEEEEKEKEWTAEERNILISAYFTRCSSKQVGNSSGAKNRYLEDIVDDLGDQGVDRSKYQVMKELSLLGLLKDALKGEDTSVELEEEQKPQHSWIDSISTEDVIAFVRDSNGGAKAIQLVQRFLLEVLYCRVGGRPAWEALTEFPHPALRFQSGWTYEDPIVAHHLSRSHDIPLTAASDEEERRLCEPYFREVLRRLGFLLPSQPLRIFPVFPHHACESAEKLLELLRSLGDLPENSKFDLQAITALVSQKTPIYMSSGTTEIPSSSGSKKDESNSATPSPSIPSNMWMQLVLMHNSKKASGCM